MAGKDGKLESKGGDVIRQGFMIKRSQNKKRFTPVNYKQRWFVLTKHYLIYYDGDGERRKERGRIAVESVHVVETASLGNGSTGGGGGAVGDVAGGGDAAGGGGGIPSGLPFQVGYREAGQEYTLYLLASREQDRAEWIRAIRAVCSENSGLSGRYHAGLWSGKRWSCCRLSTRSAEGCDTCSSWSSKPTNATNPSSTTTSASTTSTSVPGSIVNNTISTTIVTSDHRPQSTNAEANNNPIVQSQTRSTIVILPNEHKRQTSVIRRNIASRNCLLATNLIMFKYHLIVLVFWCEIQRYDVYAQTDISLKSPEYSLPLASPLNSDKQNGSEELNKKSVTMNGHINYINQVDQQIFYIYDSLFFKRLLSDTKNDSFDTSNNMSTHKFYPNKFNWNNARQTCIRDGGHLAIINSDSEEKILSRMLQENNVDTTWLGLHDLYEEGNWVTVLDQSIQDTGYTRWTNKWPNEPDNFGGNQNCAILIKGDAMDDVNCNTVSYFICEFST